MSESVLGTSTGEPSFSLVQAISETDLSISTSRGGVYRSGDYLFMLDHSSDVLASYDITDLTNPTQVSTVGTQGNNPSSVIIDGNTAYVGSIAGDAVETIDVSDPSNMTALSRTTNFGEVYGLGKSGDYVYASEGFGWGFVIVDVSDINNVNLIERYQIPASNTFNVTVDGGKLYVKCSGFPVSMFDLSSPETPAYIGSTEGLSQELYVKLQAQMHYDGTYMFAIDTQKGRLQINEVELS